MIWPVERYGGPRIDLLEARSGLGSRGMACASRTVDRGTVPPPLPQLPLVARRRCRFAGQERFDGSPRAQVDGWLVKISRERVRWYRASSRRDLGEFVGHLVVASGDVDELEAMELVLESTDFLAVRLHFWVVAVGGFHHLVDDELRVASNVEAPNS